MDTMDTKLSNEISALKKELTRVRKLKSELTRVRKLKTEAANRAELLEKALQHSELKGFIELINSEPSYSGGIFDRLGQVSRWLTALSWDEYPYTSFDNFLANVQEISPRLAELVDRDGINYNYAIVAPNESDPSDDQLFQLSNGLALSPSPNKGELRAYLLELFWDIDEKSEVAKIYDEFRDELDRARDILADELLSEINYSLKALGLNIDILCAIAE